MARALVHLPPSPRRGEVFEIRTLIAHPMESGFRVDAEGRVRPRNLIRRFTCHFDGELVFSALKDLDKVAFVRFASVYREFQDVHDFVDELQPILDGRRREM